MSQTPWLVFIPIEAQQLAVVWPRQRGLSGTQSYHSKMLGALDCPIELDDGQVTASDKTMLTTSRAADVGLDRCLARYGEPKKGR